MLSPERILYLVPKGLRSICRPNSLTLGLGIISVALFLTPQTAQTQSKGWTQLFNGRDLTGWEHVGPGRFVIENHMLKTEGGMGLLWYSRKKSVTRPFESSSN